ncbi:MAG: sigma-54 dependent transcriptional regulator [Candidatus Hydrogenedentes bacterium]|nr:sigma-54 dependent transcriptional regulator [Candidatus Hydrogenedentota bacterium]
MRIHIVDDDMALCRSLQIQLEEDGHSVGLSYTGAEGFEQIESTNPDIVFLDLNLPDTSGLDILHKLQDAKCASVSIMITGVQDAKSTIQAIRAGAFDYIRKPLDLDAVLVAVEKAARHIRSRRPKLSTAIDPAEGPPHEIVGADEKIIEILKAIARLDENQVPVLIVGDSGTGKELVARTLYETTCPDQPFVAVNCSAVVATLLESELFGHEKGAFTGADAARSGKMELAGEGILFLDEIGDMSQDLQAKLLRVLQEREFERVGGEKLLRFKGRIVAATNRDLPKMIAEGAFREDLYYRLAVSTIEVPALRDRRADIPALAEYIVSGLNRELHKELTAIEQGALHRLQAYDWPGNVRELVNVLTRAALLSRDSTITEEILLNAMGHAPPHARNSDEPKTLRQAEKEHVEHALLSTGWNIKRTAEQLGVSRVTLRKKIDDYHLKKPPQIR